MWLPQPKQLKLQYVIRFDFTERYKFFDTPDVLNLLILDKSDCSILPIGI